MWRMRVLESWRNGGETYEFWQKVGYKAAAWQKNYTYSGVNVSSKVYDWDLRESTSLYGVATPTSAVLRQHKLQCDKTHR